MPLTQVGQAPVTHAELVSGRGRSVLHTRVAGGLVGQGTRGYEWDHQCELVPSPTEPLYADCLQAVWAMEGYRGCWGVALLTFLWSLRGDLLSYWATCMCLHVLSCVLDSPDLVTVSSSCGLSWDGPAWPSTTMLGSKKA